jgi:hypothetical protein
MFGVLIIFLKSDGVSIGLNTPTFMKVQWFETAMSNMPLLNDVFLLHSLFIR